MSIIKEKRQEVLHRIVQQHEEEVQTFLDNVVVPYFVGNLGKSKKKFKLPDSSSEEFLIALYEIATKEYDLFLYRPLFGKKKIIISLEALSTGM